MRDYLIRRTLMVIPTLLLVTMIVFVLVRFIPGDVLDMMMAPWMMLWPGLALSLVVFAFNMLADALRDLLDPRLRGGLGRYGMSHEKLRRLAEKKGAGMQREASEAYQK